jgi:hypothetical protein
MYGHRRSEESVKRQPPVDLRSFDVRTPFLESRTGSRIQEQLEVAFGDCIPSGRMCLVRSEKDLQALQIHGAETINPIDRRKVLLLTQSTRFLKTVPRMFEGNQMSQFIYSELVRCRKNWFVQDIPFNGMMMKWFVRCPDHINTLTVILDTE